MVDFGSSKSVGNGRGGATAERLADDFRDQVNLKARRALDKAQDVYDRASVRARQAGRQADRLISEKTYPALGVAAVLGVGVGLALGLALGGRD